MTDNTMEYMTVSMCGADALDWCRGYNEAVTKANEIINHQNAEIERWIEESGKQSVLWARHFEGIFETAKETIKAEAIKDFAERLKELYTGEIITDDMHCSVAVIKANIDDIAKEMIGEQE